jgi:GAF domain-containing protein
LAQAAENLRLIDETQRRAAREKLMNEISDKIQRAQSLEEALQVAVKEVGVNLKVPQAVVRLALE